MMQRLTTILLGLFLFGLILNGRGVFIPEVALSQECNMTDYKSPITKVNTIELYTSEGCSSCPPAEKWVNSLYSKKGLWNEFIPLAFHVDYWDYIGWKDPMASPNYTRRQRRYASEWQANNIYTPGFVLNGKEWRTFIKRNVPSKTNKRIGILEAVKLDRDSFQVTFKPEKKRTSPLFFHMALLGHGIENKIKRGENRGRKLKHNFAVLGISSTQVFKKNADSLQATLDIPKASVKAPQLALAFWVSEAPSQAPLQATGGCFVPSAPKVTKVTSIVNM